MLRRHSRASRIFSPGQVFCVIDFETRHGKSVKDLGSFEYAQKCKLLCVAWRVGTLDDFEKKRTKTQVWSPWIPSPYGSLKKALLDKSIILVAHNAFFEKMVLRYCLSKLINEPYLKEIENERWVCTASLARVMALPGKLEKACEALDLSIQKDKEGHRLMMKMSKPRKPTKNNPARWHNKKSDMLRLMEYCRTDVDAEIELLLNVPELSPYERQVWLMDQEINETGFRVDRELVRKIIGWIKIEKIRFLKETEELAHGEIDSVNQRAKLLKLVNRIQRQAGYYIFPNLQKKTIEDALKEGRVYGTAKKLLKLRLESSKISVEKYPGFANRSNTDGRLRDSLIYHLASTGRFGGGGIQPHNFPKGHIKDMDLLCEVLRDPETDLELIRYLWGNPLDVFASALRGMILPDETETFFGGDFTGIELSVLFWMSGHTRGLNAIRNKEDLYIDMAAEIFKTKLSLIQNPSPERELGKRAILGCGFGMGALKFFQTCEKEGQPVSMKLATAAVNAYRTKHAPVKRFWSNLEKAAMAATKNPGKKYTINRTSWWVQEGYLWCQLPSGRKLAYFGPEVKTVVHPKWGPKEVLFHWGVNPRTKKWEFAKTWGGVLAENVVQATARDRMVHSMFVTREAGYKPRLTVHDELANSKKIGNVVEFEKLMSRPPEWMKDCPIRVKAWSGERYRKAA